MKKSDITKEKLLSLGFKRVDVSAEESGDKPYYYFIYRTIYENVLLITNANDEFDGKFYVEYFDLPEIGRIIKYSDLKKMIKLIEAFNVNVVV